MNIKQKVKILFNALVAIVSLLLFYFIIVTAVSGFRFTLSQFSSYWYFLISLALGFGIQIGLYSYLKQLVKNSGMIIGSKTVAVTGTTSTVAMISCCAHYLTNILPILGTIGLVTFVAQYQIQFFWVGLVFNIIGILYMLYKIKKVKTV